MNTEFYKIMVDIKREKECSIRELAKECGICPGTLIEFFNKNKPFRPLLDKTMARLHKHLGIGYDIMEKYNEEVYRQRKYKE